MDKVSVAKSAAQRNPAALAPREAEPRATPRLTVDEHPSLGLQISIENDQHGFRIKGPKYAGTSRRLLTAELDDRARHEIAGYIGYGDLLSALQRLETPAPGVKRLPAWAVGIAHAAIAKALGSAPDEQSGSAGTDAAQVEREGSRDALNPARAAISKARR